MKTRGVLIALTPTVVLALILIVQVRELSRTRREVDELRASMEELAQLQNEQEAVVSDLEAEKIAAATRERNLELVNEMLRDRNEKLLSEVEEKDAAIARLSKESGTSPAVTQGEDTTTEDTVGGGGATEELGEYIAEMLNNPEMKEMIRENQKAALGLIYGGLFEELLLTDEELEAFKEVLVNRQMAMMELGIPLMQGDIEEEEQKALEEKLKETQARLDDEIKQLLGEARYEQYEDYNKNIGDRMALSQYKTRLETAGVEPLEKRQEEELLQVLKEEREKGEYSADFADQNNLDISRFTDENVRKYLAEREAMVERVLERSETILTHDQLEAYRASMESQLKMQKIQMEMAAKLLGGRSNVGDTDDAGNSGGNEGTEAEREGDDLSGEETGEEGSSGE